MQKQGKFILLNISEFKTWLSQHTFRRKIHLIQIHHTWKPNYKSFKNNYFSLLTGMEGAHLKRGMTQIAQNITIFPDGVIAICRPIDIAPAGIKGANSYGICIENIGNFDSEVMNEAHKSALIQAVALLLKKFNLPANTNTVVYHHWYDLNSGLRLNGKGSTKTCPGSRFFGGNTVDAAQKYLIPLIAKQLNPSTPKPVMQVMNNKGIVIASTLACLILPQNGAKSNGTLRIGAKLNIYGSMNGFYLVNKVTPQWVAAKYVKVSC